METYLMIENYYWHAMLIVGIGGILFLMFNHKG